MIEDLVVGAELQDDDIIFWHDGPRAFSYFIKGQRYIFWQIDEDYHARTSRYLMVKSTTENFNDLIESKKPVFDCLTQDEVYLWDVAYDYSTDGTVLVCRWEDIPKDNLPTPGVFLTVVD